MIGRPLYNASGDFNPTRWALWGGTSIMVFSSLATVALQWRTIAARLHSIQEGRPPRPQRGDGRH